MNKNNNENESEWRRNLAAVELRRVVADSDCNNSLGCGVMKIGMR